MRARGIIRLVTVAVLLLAGALAVTSAEAWGHLGHDSGIESVSSGDLLHGPDAPRLELREASRVPCKRCPRPRSAATCGVATCVTPAIVAPESVVIVAPAGDLLRPTTFTALTDHREPPEPPPPKS